MELSRFYLLGLCALLIVCWAPPAQGQWADEWEFEAGTSVHVSGYCGDIGNQGSYGVFSDTQWYLIQSGGGLSFSARPKGKRMGINFDVRRIRIQGADSLSNKAVAFVRNLHFRNDMTELATTLDYPLLRLGSQIGGLSIIHSLRAEWGMALVHHAPRAQVDRDNLCYDLLIEMGYTTPGEWHDLRSVRTEGDSYARWIATVPFGFSWAVSADNGSGKPWHITLSGLFRYTWTDRLDDIHHQYANPWGMSPLGLALTSQSNPEDQPPCAMAPSISTFQYQQGLEEDQQPIRGNADTRDMYFTIGLKVSRSLVAAPSQTFHRKRFRGPRVNNKR